MKHAPLCYELFTLSLKRFCEDFRAKWCALALYESLKMLACEASVYKVFDVVKVACFMFLITEIQLRRCDHAVPG